MENYALFRELGINFQVDFFLSSNAAENVCLFPVLASYFSFLKGSKLTPIDWSEVSISLTCL